MIRWKKFRDPGLEDFLVPFVCVRDRLAVLITGESLDLCPAILELANQQFVADFQLRKFQFSDEFGEGFHGRHVSIYSMPFYIELPPRGPLKTHEFKSPQQADRILTQIFKGRKYEEGEHYNGLWICADGNCYSETEWPMNQYVAGLPGTVVLTNRGPGFTSGEIARACANIARSWMTIEEAEVHRPPAIKMDIQKQVCRITIIGESTPQGMFSIDPFIEHVRGVAEQNNATVEIERVAVA